MLTTYLNNLPYFKFILIEDNVEERGRNILNWIIKHRSGTSLRYFVFEGNFKQTQNVDGNVSYHDFVSDIKGWLDSNNKPNLYKVISTINSPNIIIIDSLVHLVYEYGFKEAYRILHGLINNKNVLQVITILHGDMLEDQVTQYFQHLCSMYVKLESKFNSDKSRVVYTCKKSSGKIIKEVKKIEQFWFENGNLKTEPIKKLDPKVLIQETVQEVSPDSLTTFKISLDEEERKARDRLVLPYLPKEEEVGGGKIFYQFDDVDDWDEEDPDDDLDI